MATVQSSFTPPAIPRVTPAEVEGNFRKVSGPDRDWRPGQPSSPEKYRERLLKRFWSKVDTRPGLGPNGDCWEWAGSRRVDKSRRPDEYGHYGQLGMVVNGKRNPLGAHVVAWAYIYGHEIPEGHELCHKCNYKPCVKEDHLFTGTHLTNLHHAMATGRIRPAKPKPEKLKAWNVGPARKQRALLRRTRRARGVGFSWLCRVLELDVSHLSKLETGKDRGRSLRLEKMVCLLRILGLDEQSFLNEATLTYGYAERKTEAAYRRRQKNDLARVTRVQGYDNSAFKALIESLAHLPQQRIRAITKLSDHFIRQLLKGEPVKPYVFQKMKALVESRQLQRAA